MVDYVLNADLRLKKSTKRKPCLATIRKTRRDGQANDLQQR